MSTLPSRSARRALSGAAIEIGRRRVRPLRDLSKLAGLDFLTPAIVRRLRKFYTGSDVLASMTMAESLQALDVGANGSDLGPRGVVRALHPTRRSDAWRRAQNIGTAAGSSLCCRLVRKGPRRLRAAMRVRRTRHECARRCGGDAGAADRLVEIAGAHFRPWAATISAGRWRARHLVNQASPGVGCINLEAMAARPGGELAPTSATPRPDRGQAERLLVPPDKPALADAVEPDPLPRARALGLPRSRSAPPTMGRHFGRRVALYQAIGF